ncbi:helicase-related protein [Fontisphaera persica]|uniref:helicase-related protein n=1 Tax=Fontisphaera persica TaxID=2974023 RepID=UPI0031B8301F
MHRPPEDVMREMQRDPTKEQLIDRVTLARLKNRTVQSFKEQIEFGLPTSAAEEALRTLARQLRARKVRIKLFLAYPLHAKLYLIHRQDRITPLVGYLGSSNLTLAGLSQQGELNVDVVDQDAANKLQSWFNDRWNNLKTFDLSAELASLIENSWARETLVAPYHVYLKMAWHLSEDARTADVDFKVPKVFHGVLLDFQVAAVKLAAKLLHRHGGVLLADVVGLGKTLMACAVAKIFQEDEDANILVICPPKLQNMWERYLQQYKLPGRVLSLGKVINGLPTLTRYRLVIIDESHNFRNREGDRYRAILNYLETMNPRVILLTATPYNKQYADLSNQLRLFLDPDADLRVRPERFFQDWHKQGKSEADFIARYQASPRSLRAFEQSPYPEDWQDLMRHYMVRRTRNFIIANYAQLDSNKKRHYLLVNGNRSYLPVRQPKTQTFAVDDQNPNDTYARLYCDNVVTTIASLALPRYGLANYLIPNADQQANDKEKIILNNLNRAGKRLLGFCRTNLFKRLESSGYSFLLSIERHILRNLIHVHALENNLPVPIGTQNASSLDPLSNDTDEEYETEAYSERNPPSWTPLSMTYRFHPDLKAYAERAAENYKFYEKYLSHRFHWLPAKFFQPQLKDDLLRDVQALLKILQTAKEWDPQTDAKLQVLQTMLTHTHPKDKVLVFSQFADTALYLGRELKRAGLSDMEVVTSFTQNPDELARCFSPRSNGGLPQHRSELRLLITTDLLSEGQNLQDAHIIINYDLPWAIIRLIQRAGRVDRIGQQHDTIFVYSFVPAEGVEKVIGLRSRLSQRLRDNQEVVGTDESFFGESSAEKLRDLYSEKRVLDDDADEDVDLVSLAQQVWNSAQPADRQIVEQLPAVISAARAARPAAPGQEPETPGSVVYLRYPDKSDALIRVNQDGAVLSQSLSAIFRAAACKPNTPALPVPPAHYDLVAAALRSAKEELETLGGQLGSMRSTRRKLYERLKAYKHQLELRRPPAPEELRQKIDTLLNVLFQNPLLEAARESLARQMRAGCADDDLVENAFRLYENAKLCQISTDSETVTEPQILCALNIQPLEPNVSNTPRPAPSS